MRRGGGAGRASRDGGASLGTWGAMVNSMALAETTSDAPVWAVWSKASTALKSELGDDTFGSWLAQAACGRAPTAGSAW